MTDRDVPPAAPGPEPDLEKLNPEERDREDARAPSSDGKANAEPIED
ncbi:hypothetical protein [Microbacterium caowuchunii]|nr:hypothetical protein [Microbacterium caowuchunii]